MFRSLKGNLTSEAKKGEKGTGVGTRRRETAPSHWEGGKEALGPSGSHSMEMPHLQPWALAGLALCPPTATIQTRHSLQGQKRPVCTGAKGGGVLNPTEAGRALSPRHCKGVCPMCVWVMVGGRLKKGLETGQNSCPRRGFRGRQRTPLPQKESGQSWGWGSFL